MTSERVKELEEQIADLKHRWPPHSVPPQMFEHLDELEQALEKARKADAKEDVSGGPFKVSP